MLSILPLTVILLVSCRQSDNVASAGAGTSTSTNLPTSTVAALTPSPTATALEPSATPTMSPVPPPVVFSGERAYNYLLEQMEFGPRWPGSPGHSAVRDYLVDELTALDWSVEEQSFDYQGIVGKNFVAKSNQGAGPIIIIGAHYDTRKRADKGPDPEQPVPGAVDGASGVAVLLELAETLDLSQVNNEIWLAFFDLEDNGGGGIEGFNWIVGSTYMAENLQVDPMAMVLVDMIGDADQQLYYERNSDARLSEKLWSIAADLGFEEYFIPVYRHTMIDDHLPFAQRGIPAVDIIDFDYPYWHTVEDTADKASPESLYRVGRTLEVWIEEGA